MKNYLRAAIIHAFRFLDAVYPKDKSLVVFAQSRGRFSDNSKALFEHISNSRSDLRAVWIARSEEQTIKIRSANEAHEVYRAGTMRGFLTALSAKTFVVSHGSTDLGAYCRPSRKTNLIMLWHAITTKRFGILDLGWNQPRISKHTLSEAPLYAAMIASSDVDRLVNSTCYGIPGNRVHVTGLPRNDILLSDSEQIRPRAIPQDPTRLVLYAPTFRDTGPPLRLFPFSDFDPEKLQAALVSLNAAVLLRPHQNDRHNREHLEAWLSSGFDRLIDARSDIVEDVAQLMPHVRAIITDYSSIYLDGLLNDTPAIFIPYDRDIYESTRGILFDYDLITPGPKVESQSALLQAIDEALSGANAYAAKRGFLRKMFHMYSDGNSSSRVEALIKKL